MQQGFDVKGEVKDCDVTAVRDDIIIIVEMKKSLNLDVILQAVQRQKMADYTYIAVPKRAKTMRTKRWRNICYLLRRLELGLLLVSFRGETFKVERHVKPEPFKLNARQNQRKKNRVMLLNEFTNRHGDYNKGGVTGRKIVTAYREMAIHIAVLLKKHGNLSIKQLRELGTDANKTSSILQKNYYSWFERVTRGVYKITDYAVDELKKYKELVSFYENEAQGLKESDKSKGNTKV